MRRSHADFAYQTGSDLLLKPEVKKESCTVRKGGEGQWFASARVCSALNTTLEQQSVMCTDTRYQSCNQNT